MTIKFDNFDLLIVGGGVNGCGIARDAAGRGLKVALVEKSDLASATSSSSSKLFHGGLRYLEQFDLRLVRESLSERNELLRAMPHISWPMRFVLPHNEDLRSEEDTPLNKLNRTLMPWLKGRRPAWMVRMGLFLYDSLAGASSLPGTATIDLATIPHAGVLKDSFTLGFEYSDCWVDDARLVALNACDAASRGATILTRTEVVGAKRTGRHWRVTVKDAAGTRELKAASLVNAAGPWANLVQASCAETTKTPKLRLVRGSHVVVRQVYAHDRCYIMPSHDGRVIFTIPYEGRFTLIGTTDVEQEAPQPVKCSDEEIDYLLASVGAYFTNGPTRADVVWTYAGVRALYASADSSATAASRDYNFGLDAARGKAPLLNVFGGKITTHRRLAEHALAKLKPHLPKMGKAWTRGAPLPGGDFALEELAQLGSRLRQSHPFLDDAWAARLVRLYGTLAPKVLGQARKAGDLGEDFGATLTEAEASYLRENEFAKAADDVLWRRTKLGLHMSKGQRTRFASWFGNTGKVS